MHRITALAIAAALLVAACGGSTSTDSVRNTSSATSDSTPDTAPGSEPGVTAAPGTDIDALVADALAMPFDEQQTYVATLATDFERELSKLSGLEDALGGPEATDAALTAAWAPLLDELRSTLGAPIQSGFGPVARADGPNIGEGLFGAYMTAFLGAEGAVVATNKAEAGDPPKSEGDPSFMVSGSLEEASLDIDVTHTTDGVTTKLKMHIKVLPCPGPDGHFIAEATAEISVVAGSVGQNGTFSVKIDGTVDDDANLSSVAYDHRMQWADFAGGKGQFIDVSGGTGKEPVVNRQGGAATSKFASEATLMGAMMGALLSIALSRAAEAGWKSGRCVRIDTTAAPGPSKLEPGSTSAVTAAPRSKVDGMPTGGSVTATLASGGKGIDPSATKIRADASFTYSAPDEKDKSGTVAFEARSKRGVGTAEITFDTKGGSYTAAYDGGGISIRGTIADLAKPFDTIGTITGGQVAFHYVPTDAESGSISHNDPCGPGCVAAGSGTYTITETGAGDGTLTMTMAVNTCVTVTAGFSQKICEDKVHPVLLTPA